MLKLLVFYSLMIISLIHIVHIGLYVIGANIYDIRKLVRRGRARQAAPYNPLVSVVIPAHNEQTGVVRTIKTVLANTYKNVEIIVVDDGSTDNTAQIVRSFIRQNYASNNPLRYFGRSGRAHNLERRFIRGTYGGPRIVLVRQLNAGKGAAVTNGIKNYANGELIMTLDADSLLYKRAINNAVAYFRDPKVLGVAANVQVMDNGTALSVLQKIEHLIGYRSKKFYSVANCEMIIGGVASTYRASTLRQVGYYDTDTVTEDIGLSMKVIAENGNKDYRLEYGVDVVACTEAVQSYKALFRQRYRWKMGMLQNLLKNRHIITLSPEKYSLSLTAYRLPMAFVGELILLIEPLILVYILYLSFQFVSFGAFLGAYLLLTAYILWTLIPDEHLTAVEKVRYCLLSPVYYFLFYVMNAVQVVAMLRCIWNYRQTLGIDSSPTTWISPERAGVKAPSLA